MKKRIRKLFTFPFEFIGRLFAYIRERVIHSLRIQLILTFALSLFAAFIAAWMVIPLADSMNRYAEINYFDSKNQMDQRARYLAEEINRSEDVRKQTNERIRIDLQNVFRPLPDRDNMNFFIADGNGRVIYKTKNTTETQVDLHSIFSKAMGMRDEQSGNYDDTREYITIYPVKVNDLESYLIAMGIPEGQIEYKYSESTLPFFIAVIVFFLSFYYLTQRKMKQIHEISYGMQQIAKGNLDYRVGQQGHDELGALASNINHMAEQLQIKIAQERKAEKTKSELITNVSHDLRTPLTAIMGYLRLVRDKKHETQEQQDEYIRIAYNKSEKLKLLIDDLFEYTKLANHQVKLHKETVWVNELLEQLVEEYVPQADANQMSFIKDFPREKIGVNVDTNSMVRVFENLLGNALQYGMKPGHVRIVLKQENDNVFITVENLLQSPIPDDELPRLFQRFYKQDHSRGANPAGSGLGLAIAKSIVELHQGDIWAESDNRLIKFVVQLQIAQSSQGE